MLFVKWCVVLMIPNITHVDGKVDPIRDIETIKIELNLADLESIEKRIQRLEKKPKRN
jgi:ribosome-binding ATPase